VTSRKIRNCTDGATMRTADKVGLLRERPVEAPAARQACRQARRARAQTLLVRGQAAIAAEQAKELATPRITAAVEWAGPRLERSMERGLKAAAPRIEAAAERAVPAVDAVRDWIVEDVLPRLVETTTAAAVAGASAGEAAGEALGEATERGAHKAKAGLLRAAERAGEVSGGRREPRKARRLWIAALATAVAGVVVSAVAWRRARATDGSGEALGDIPADSPELATPTTAVNGEAGATTEEDPRNPRPMRPRE
jgi:hypothetical protein